MAGLAECVCYSSGSNDKYVSGVIVGDTVSGDTECKHEVGISC